MTKTEIAGRLKTAQAKIIWQWQQIRQLKKLVDFHRGRRNGKVDKIRRIASEIWDLSPNEIASDKRGSLKASEARQSVMVVAKEAGICIESIAASVGRKQGVVFRSLKTVKDLSEVDPNFAAKLQTLRERVKNL